MTHPRSGLRRSLTSKCGFATLLVPLGGRTTYVVGLGALSRGQRQRPGKAGSAAFA
jgi:hypothetical protein